jgi:hypothetical protein
MGIQIDIFAVLMYNIMNKFVNRLLDRITAEKSIDYI